MFTTLIVFQVLMAVGLISIVLVQRGPGATMGAAFGSGASGTVFGSRGAGNFLTRTTSWLAVGFFGISLSLAVLATSLSVQGGSESALSGSVMEQQQAEQAETGSGIESVIDDLDNPPAEQEDGTPADAEQPEAAAAETAEEDDGTLSESQSGS